MGKAFINALPKLGSGGPGDEPVRVGVGQRPLTKEELFNGYLDLIQDLPFETKVAALTAVGVGTQFARAISKGIASGKGSGFPFNPRDVSRVTSYQNDYQKAVKDFAKYTSQMPALPQVVIDEVKSYGGNAFEGVGKYIAKELNDAYENYRLVPTTGNKSILDNIVNKYGGYEHIILSPESVTLSPNPKLEKIKAGYNLAIVNEELANLAAGQASRALSGIKNYTGKDIAEAEAIAAKPTISGAVKGGLGAVGNAYTNALSFLRGGGGPKTTGS